MRKHYFSFHLTSQTKQISYIPKSDKEREIAKSLKTLKSKFRKEKKKWNREHL